MEKLPFFDPRDEYSGFLSNFYRAPFWLDGVLWPTVEHAYQAAKFTDPAYAESIRNADTPRAAKTLGQTREHPLQADWDTRKLDVMLSLVAAKFCLSGGVALMECLLKTKDKLLIEASPTDGYWGAGEDGKGANHLGRILMAVRDVLLYCDHDNMQAKPGGDAQTLHVRMVGAAALLLADTGWNPAYRPPGLHIHVLRGSLYGQGVKDLRESLRPWLGIALAACWGEQSWGSPQLVLQAKEPEAESIRMPHGLHIFQQTSWRLGYRRVHSVAIQAADADWREPETATMPMPPWRDFLEQGADDSGSGGAWALEAVSVIKGPSQDDDFNRSQFFQPAAQAILLTFSSGEMHLYVALYAVHDEGFSPQVRQYEVNPALDIGTPYGPPWELLLCSESKGALPKIEAAFAEYFAHEGYELPLELVVNRRACGALEDDMVAICAWNISVVFGRDKEGEYLDMDSAHRMCGEDYVRFHEDGRTTRREECIAPERFQAPEQPESTAAGYVEPAPPLPPAVAPLVPVPPEKHWGARGLGVLVMLIGLYIGWNLVNNAPRPFQMIIFSVVMVVMGGWLAWRPDDLR